jgi:hypothetical protein
MKTIECAREERRSSRGDDRQFDGGWHHADRVNRDDLWMACSSRNPIF